PSLDERTTLMKLQVARLRADIVCFQEVNGQGPQGQPQTLLALPQPLPGTNLEGVSLTSTETERAVFTTSGTWW
ncbi:MAG: hypothetical protein QOE86_2486, partial [Solirubrobacteraceae bacterium]|nr:hypothetical protein [Solirubrobacteraceae bacterium]